MNDFATARKNMVFSQIAPNQVTDLRVLGAMREVPREIFLPASKQAGAYIDQDIKLAEGSNGAANRYMMEPRVLARLLQAAEIGEDDAVLDVGCGTGYSSAVIGRLAASVISLEVDEGLAQTATNTLSDFGSDNAVVVTGELAGGYAEEAPYDVVVLEGAVEQIPQALFDQLKDGGRLVAVVERQGVGHATVYTRAGDSVAGRGIFDAGIKPLPGFERQKDFVF